MSAVGIGVLGVIIAVSEAKFQERKDPGLKSEGQQNEIKCIYRETESLILADFKAVPDEGDIKDVGAQIQDKPRLIRG